jgi:cytochrome P450
VTEPGDKSVRHSGADGFARAGSSHDDPFPFFAKLRREDPLHRDGNGLIRLTRYDDVVAVFRDDRLSANDERWQQADPIAETLGGFDSPVARARRQWFLNLDDPEHRRLRAGVAPSFTPRASASYRPAVQFALDHVLDRLRGVHETDLLESVIRPLPAAAVASALGFPPADWEQLSDWIRDVNRNFDRTRTVAEAERMNRAVVAFEAYLAERIAGATGRHAFSRLVRDARERGLSDDELVRTLTIIFVAGQHVMVKLLGGCIIRLLSGDEEARERLRNDPEQISDFVDEMLRWDNPVQGLKRIATTDVELPSGMIARDQVVVVVLPSALRDETVFPEPDVFDAGRRDPRAIPFGVGTHFCLGASVAKLEALVFVETMLRRFEGLAFVGGPPALPVSRRGVPPLPVVWDRFV